MLGVKNQLEGVFMHHRRAIWTGMVLAAVLAGCGYGETESA